MSRFIEGQDRQQVTLLPECLDDFIGEGNPVRVIDAFVAELNLGELGFDRTVPAATGRPAYDPAMLLKVYIYGYLNRIQSSRRLEHECQRNVELMWLTGRLAPDFKTIADFRRDNGTGLRNVCRRFVVLCRDLKLFAQGAVAIDGSKFKAVNSRDRNFTPAKVDKRKQQIEESIQRYMSALDTADRTLPLLEFGPRYARLKDKIKTLRERMRRYWSSECNGCTMKSQCTTADYRRISRWEHEPVIEAMQRRLDRQPEAMTLRRRTVEHVFGTLKHWMGSTHFLTRTLEHVGTEMSLHVLAYNLNRVLRVLGMAKTMKAMKLAGA
jgi:transposase